MSRMPSATLQAPKHPRLLRRLSSNTASVADLQLGPAIVVPDDLVDKESDAHEVASAMEFARRGLDGLTTEDAGTPPPVTAITDRYAFAFDIDGVLIKGGNVIPEAIEAMKMLNGQNNYGVKVPYIFLTNGGGKTEQERCIQLSKQLKMEVSPGQFICGHTPMREMAETFDTVLVVGGTGEKCREVAEGYGFKNVVTPGDVIKTNPDAAPFRTLTQEERDNSRVRDWTKEKIKAIFVFADSRDWAGDQQIILDVLMSKNGQLNTRSETFDEGPPLFFAHNDVVWATSHQHVRIGMGALRAGIEAMFKALTGKDLECTAFGKPQMGTFGYAKRLLQQWRKETHRIDLPPETIYFVGDTPESDIRGTNDFDKEDDKEWYSILVKTGVYQPGTTPTFKPKATVENVLDAVKHGIEREMKRDATHLLKGAKVKVGLLGQSVIPENPIAEDAEA